MRNPLDIFETVGFREKFLEELHDKEKIICDDNNFFITSKFIPVVFGILFL